MKHNDYSPSSVSLQAIARPYGTLARARTLKSSHPSIRTLSKSEFLPSALPRGGGMSAEKNDEINKNCGKVLEI